MKDLLANLYRVRFVMIFGAAYVLILSIPARALISSEPALVALALTTLLALVVWVLGILVSFALRPKNSQEAQTVVVSSPVRGRWLALNSPATKVPSHGTRAYGQAYAIDLVLEPLDGNRPEFGGTFMRKNQEYPAFGAPVYAMTSGTVVRASDWRRDHRARSNVASIFYLMVEGALREIGGPGFIVGNHVTIRNAEGRFFTVAHLKRGSMAVKTGDIVTEGQRIGLCGNSGNSSEPHVHAQISDRKSFWLAAGVPLAFRAVALDESGHTGDGVPANGTHMIA